MPKHISYVACESCCGCRENLRNKNLSLHVSKICEANIEKARIFFENNSINLGDYICNRCRSMVRTNNKMNLTKLNLLNSFEDKVQPAVKTTLLNKDVIIIQESEKNLMKPTHSMKVIQLNTFPSSSNNNALIIQESTSNADETNAKKLKKTIVSSNNTNLMKINIIKSFKDKVVSTVNESPSKNYIYSSQEVVKDLRKQNNLREINPITCIPASSNNDDMTIQENNLKTDKKNAKKLKKTIALPTAYASHHFCLICKQTNGLHAVKPESIMHAYLRNGIIIKHGSRCCDSHLDSSGLINEDEFKNMKTKPQIYDNDLVMILDTCLKASAKIQDRLQNTSGIFDKFKDMALLDENLCIQITGWTKSQFIKFSDLITRVYDTNGRTKDQLVAIYRYWLSKGIDQCTLALLKNNTDQRQISHYLQQIRSAMNEEVVPLLLGANKGKKFFLKHNTDSVKVLHGLEDDVLAVIIDGTYTRLEKSSNNDFQYLSYSMQKSQNLVKPFIMCCADGYFIDCYGPFQANMNDAQILKYVLSNDKDLKDLFSPAEKIIMFLDRGFRDNYSELIEEGFDVQIPTCGQLEKKKEIDPDKIKVKRDPKNEDKEHNEFSKRGKALTTEQTGETRRVTKVRFIIEKQNALLKNKKALDNIRNTQAGPILIDYRICCAMSNFSMKACVPDGKHSVQIAEILNKKCSETENKLESLLDLKFTSNLTSVEFEEVNDFPQLTLAQLKNRIIFGSFKLRKCPSYMEQLSQHGKAFFLNDTLLDKFVTQSEVKKELKFSKILAVQINSRQNNAKKSSIDRIDAIDSKSFTTCYRLFIQYIPVELKYEECATKPYDLIKRYICSCRSGHQVAGCCIHIATVIYYLGHAKEKIANDPESIKLPAVHLKSILINTHSSDLPNAPRYVRNKRRDTRYTKKERNSESDKSSKHNSDQSLNEDQDIPKFLPEPSQLSLEETSMNIDNEDSSDVIYAD